MGKIKSAWEIALEKTEGIEIDKDKFRYSENVNKARRIAGAFLTGDETDTEKLRKDLEAVDEKARKEALTASVLSSLSLPQDEVMDNRFEKTKTLASIASGNDPDVMGLLAELTEFLMQYPKHRKDLVEKMKEQFRPMLEEKEAKLRAQYGQDVHIAPETDKEFVEIATKNLERLEAQYDATLQNAKKQLKELLERN